jgi:hypothetical protein
MASLLGVDVVEKSTFRWHEGQPEGLRYLYSQEASIKSRQRSTEFDWQTHEAQSREGDKVWTAPLQVSAMDRNLVMIAMMAQLKAGAHDLAFKVVDKDKVSEQRYAQGAHEMLSLPAGKIEAVRVERQRADNSRTTISWFAPQRDWLPVQIEQVERMARRSRCAGCNTARLARRRPVADQSNRCGKSRLILALDRAHVSSAIRTRQPALVGARNA